MIDEAQRCWDAAQAVGKTRDRPVQLTMSEPAHLLDIMERHAGFAAMICLIGNGQEIHDGEGGLAEWGDALRTWPEWQVVAAPATLTASEPRNRLPRLPGLSVEPTLHLTIPVRSLRHDAAPEWVDAVLRGDAEAARAIVAREGEVPFRLTRSLAMLRTGLRAACRGTVEPTHRAGLICSASARRLRAEGLGAELPHMEADAVARWFLDRFPADVRASDALEQVATQFSVQGLELDHVGLCWDADLIRVPGETAWRVRSFSGTDWQVRRDARKIAYRLNTYRVLLTRARYQTIIWVPAGDPGDRTRGPAVLDGIADYLQSCGVIDLAPPVPTRHRQATLLPQLLLP
nr:DNA/RNA helicase domain-containing protein [uncultured Lichenicoccus sp.]